MDNFKSFDSFLKNIIKRAAIGDEVLARQLEAEADPELKPFFLDLNQAETSKGDFTLRFAKNFAAIMHFESKQEAYKESVMFYTFIAQA